MFLAPPPLTQAGPLVKAAAAAIGLSGGGVNAAPTMGAAPGGRGSLAPEGSGGVGEEDGYGGGDTPPPPPSSSSGSLLVLSQILDGLLLSLFMLRRHFGKAVFQGLTHVVHVTVHRGAQLCSLDEVDSKN